MTKGALCISIDVELAWGVWDIVTPGDIANCLRLERGIVRRLVELFERYDIPVTWAVVGHLLERRPDRPDSEVPAWYAPDVIDAIRGSRVEHEIGSHSFGHVYFAELSRDEAEADLARMRDVHQRHDLSYESFVFPRNMVAHEGALARAGVRVFRGKDRGWFTLARGRLARRVTHLADAIVPVTPAVVEPVSRADGLVELPGSMLLMSRNGLRRLILPRLVKLKAKRGLRAAVRSRRVFHLWFHPSNFYFDAEGQFGALEAVLEEAARLRRAGRLDVRTMRSFATANATAVPVPA